MKGLSSTSIVLSLGVLAAVTACQSSSDEGEDIGTAELNLLDVPIGVGCIRVSAAGSRVVTRNFDVFSNQHSQFSMNGLPLGNVLFSAEAFNTTCSGIGSTVASWSGGPISAVLSAGTVAAVTVPMKRNGSANVGVDFNDPQCALEGAACTTNAECCAGSNLTATCNAGVCVQACNGGFGDCNANKALDGCEAALASDENNCGTCGSVCPIACEQGLCLDSTLTVDGTSYIGRRMTDSIGTSGITAPLSAGGLCDTTNAAWAGTIVLCQRGTNTFAVKGQNVAASGGLAAVVYNNIAGNVFGTLNGVPVSVPVVGITQADGEFLVTNKLGVNGTLVAP